MSEDMEGFLGSLIDARERELEWQKKEVARDEAQAEVRIMRIRGERIARRLNEIFFALYGEELDFIDYEENQDGPYMFRRITIHWRDDDLEDLIRV